MPTQSKQELGSDPSACVADIRHLCVEFQRAIVALASDDVDALENGIPAQEKLADKLQDWFHNKPSGEQSVTLDAAKFRELINLTRVYSALLQRSLRSARLRAALCRTYQQSLPSAVNEEKISTNWSCEV